MLADATIQPMIPVTDLAQARKFYGDTLGLKEEGEMVTDHVMFDCGGGTKFTIYKRGPSKADHTLASFFVNDLEAEMNELRGKGVKFEEYDFPGLKTVNGIAAMGTAKAAWFKDPDRNIIGITQL